MLKKELLEILACPACRKPVAERENEVVCRACGRRYPIRDGIPVMLVDEARGGKQRAGRSTAQRAGRSTARKKGKRS